MQHKRYLISGKVQGVSYRRFAEREANLLGLVGEARNLQDGRVEILATGPHERLIAFEARLAEGPSHANVLSVAKEDVPSAWFNDKLEGETFRVGSDGEEPWAW